MIRTSVKIDGVQISNHDLSSISLHQEVGTHHHFEIRFNRDAGKNLLRDYTKKYIGSSVTLGFDHIENDQLDGKSAPDYFKGVVTGVSISANDGSNTLVLHGQSPTVHMDGGPVTRSFENMGVQEIIDKVSSPYKSRFSKGITVQPRNTRPLPYTVQYQESNFHFLQRLASRFGDWFYYDGFELFFGQPGSGPTTELSFGEGGLQSFDLSVQSLASKLNLSGYDYFKNSTVKAHNSDHTKRKHYGSDAKSGASKLFPDQVYSSIGNQESEGVIKDIVERHAEIAEDELVIASGSSQVSSLKLGGVLSLKDKGIGENHGEYIVTRISHYISQTGNYSNEFIAYPTEKETPPTSASPMPPFCEAQIARVVDVEDPQALGRVLVEFVWNEEDGGKSPWLRILTPYAGKDRGMFITPEVDDMVLVAFENNDADRPYVLGGMYHADTEPEWFSPENHFKGFKTRSGNQLQFDDKKELINITAPKEMELKTNGKSDSTITIDVGQGKLILKAGEIILEGKTNVKIESKGGIEMESKTSTGIKALDAKIEAKTSFLAEGKASAEIKGANVNVSGQAATIVKGGIIKLN